MTSHAAQGQTADRVLIHVDTALGAKDLLNTAWHMGRSRAGHSTPSCIPTIRAGLAQALGRTVSKESAHTPELQREREQVPEREATRARPSRKEHGWGLGLGR